MDCNPPGSSVPGDSPGKNTGVGCHAPPPEDLPNLGVEHRSPSLQADSLPSEPQGSPYMHVCVLNMIWVIDLYLSFHQMSKHELTDWGTSVVRILVQFLLGKILLVILGGGVVQNRAEGWCGSLGAWQGWVKAALLSPGLYSVARHGLWERAGRGRMDPRTWVPQRNEALQVKSLRTTAMWHLPSNPISSLTSCVPGSQFPHLSIENSHTDLLG